MTKLEKVFYYLENQVKNHSIYLWSGQGKPKVKNLTAVEICKLETSEENAVRVMKEIYKRQKAGQIDKYTKPFDCSGLIICAFIYAGLLPSTYDNTADGLYRKYTHVSRKDIQKGDLIFKLDASEHAYHIGMYKGNGKVIEAKGRDYGVVEWTIDSSWNGAARPEYE